MLVIFYLVVYLADLVELQTKLLTLKTKVTR
nr:MAG TPA: hypothetical protein [Caudoviricetes sp.]